MLAFLQDALPGILPPALVAAILLAPLLRLGDGVAAAILRTLAPAAAALAGFVALLGWPDLPPGEALDWLPWLALAGGAAGLVLDLPALPAPVRGAGRLLLTGGAAWLLSSPYRDWLGWSDTGLLAGSAAIGLAWALLWAALEGFARRRPGPALPLVLTITATAVSILSLLAGGARQGQLAGVLATAAGVAVALAWLRPGVSWARGGVAAPTLVHGGLVLLAWLNLSPDLPVAAVLLLGLAPLAAWAGEGRARQPEGRSLPALARRAFLAALPLAVAALLTWRQTT